jgi:hypothetical protein
MGGQLIGGGGQPIMPAIKQPRINPEDLPVMHCCECDATKFLTVSEFRAISVLQAPPHGGQAILAMTICANPECNAPLDVKRSQQWASLSDEDRDKAREQMWKARDEKAKKMDKKGKK